MSNLRKLQGEIEKTLKKVQEGLGVFDEIWDQVGFLGQFNQSGQQIWVVWFGFLWYISCILASE
jgi:hypothetical protein